MATGTSDWSLHPPLHPPKLLARNDVSKSIPYILPLTISTKKRRLLIVSCYKSSTTPLLESSPSDLRIISLTETSALSVPESPAKEIKITNKLIRGLCGDRETELLAFEYYKKAREQQNFQPEQRTLNTLVIQVIKAKQWSFASYLIEDFIVLDVLPDEPTCARFIGFCIKSRKLRLAESLLGVIETKNDITAVSVFSAAMYGYNKLHMYRSTVSVYDRFRKAGLSPSFDCYRSVMEAYRAMGDTDLVVSVFFEYKSEKWYSSAASLDIYAIVCDSLGRSGRALEALQHLREMEAEGLSPSASIYASVIRSFANAMEADMAESVFKEAVEKQMVKDPAVFEKLVIMYVEVGPVENTLAVVRNMMDVGVKVTDCVFCAVVNGFAKRRGLRSGLRAFQHLQSRGCEPGQVSYASIINVCCRLGLTEEAEEFFADMMEKGFDKCIVAYSNMISMYGKIGKASAAMKLLAMMKQKGCKPNLWVYNSLLDMHGKLMKLRQVEKNWKEMKRRNIEPDRISYTAIISAYNKAGESSECIKLYQEFKASGGKLDRALAGVMLGVFSKSSLFNELIELLQEMKAESTGLDRRLYESGLSTLQDAGIQVHENWFERNFSFKEEKT